MAGRITAEWVDGRREPQNPPDPRYPLGIDVDMSRPGYDSCSISLPYPAKRCGVYVIKCATCGLQTVITTAGRPDDPRSAKVACRVTRQ